MSATRTQLPDDLRARYGVRPTSPLLVAGVVVLVAAFAAVVGWAALKVANPDTTNKLLAWRVVSDDRTDVTFEVRRDESQDVACVLRAQDAARFDVAYATVELPRGTSYVQTTYSLRTNARPAVVEVLGCAAGGAPARVPPPQFPPGVGAPEQPWTPAAG